MLVLIICFDDFYVRSSSFGTHHSTHCEVLPGGQRPNQPIFSATTLAAITMGMSYTLVVFLIILGAAACVGMGWGIWSLHNGRQVSGSTDAALQDPEQDQAVYMREVRLRQHEMLQNAYGRKYMV